MLFNDPIFLFIFLPVTLLGFGLLARYTRRGAMLWLVVASLVFYAWWNPRYLILLFGSVLVNYGTGLAIHRAGETKRRKGLLTAGVAANLLLLGYFKYARFFVGAAAGAVGASVPLPDIVLPLAISFFTFTEIAYLVDVYRGKTHENNLLYYGLFVTFFPHLIAGPIVHHRQVIGQFRQSRWRFHLPDFTVGLTIFMLGLFKKVCIADAFVASTNAVFSKAQTGGHPTLFEAWGAALGFALQLYFDFSGYSDMAVGLARMFGIRFPINFNSPYKAVNIIDFWRRWHITLSEFLRDYLYIPLGGNRRGPIRRYLNLFATMLLGGLWHGAGWTFLLWGGLHGLYLCVNHAWRGLFAHRPNVLAAFENTPGRWIGRLLTFGAVLVGWVFFRADSLPTALRILHGMTGANGKLPTDLMPTASLFPLLVALAIAWFLPNTQEFMTDADPAMEPVAYRGRLRWRGPTPMMGFALGLLAFFIALNFFAAAPSAFLYFHF